MSNLQELFGQIDIYLFDQLLRGRVKPGQTIVDAGCGSGRNLVYFLREGYRVFGVDKDVNAIRAVQSLSASLSPGLPAGNFRVERVEAMSITEGSADLVISSAVLHFARDDDQFREMLHGTWRAIKPGGLLFCRLASSIGMESRVKRTKGNLFLLPDGSERYLVDETLLENLTRELDGEPMDPLKTAIVQDQRCMTTWVLRKNAVPLLHP